MDNALVVNLNISMWSGHKLDKAKTSEVNHNANADSDASRVNKHLVSKTSMADIVNAPAPCASTSTGPRCRGVTTVTA